MSNKNRNPYLISTVKCATPGCSNVRRQTNHWYVTAVDDEVFTCRPYSAGSELSNADEPVCGQACAQKLFEKYLAKKTV